MNRLLCWLGLELGSRGRARASVSERDDMEYKFSFRTLILCVIPSLCFRFVYSSLPYILYSVKRGNRIFEMPNLHLMARLGSVHVKHNI